MVWFSASCKQTHDEIQRRKEITSLHLELHTIVIDDGQAEARRAFGIGKFDGKKETIPADFLAFEDEMKRLRNSVFPSGAKTFHFAPAINF